MKTNCQLLEEENEFNRPGRATQDTEWVQDPTNPAATDTGKVRKGELVWFRRDLFGTGPAWQPARLTDKASVYVHPHHFENVNGE